MGTESAQPPVVELQGLEVRYGKRVALDQLTATVVGGAIGLLGPNGAGKSTLIKTLLGLIPIHEGRAKILGRDVQREARVLRRTIGYMPEREAAFPGMTGFQATWYAGRLSGLPDADARRRAHEVLLFAGLEEERYRDVGTYSTGMRQRVKLAQALVHDPDLVFLDEPTNGLDPQGRSEMLALIRTLAQDKGIHVLLSTHLLMDVEEVCESVVVVNGGRIVRNERIEELTRSFADARWVQLDGDMEAFVAALGERGLEVVERKGHDCEVRLRAEGETGPVFEAAAATDSVVRSLRPVRLSLEEALIDVLGSEAA